MNYLESEQVFELVESSKRVLLNCHNHPDPDSIGSATSMYEILVQMNKEVDIYCPSELQDQFKFIPNSELVQVFDYGELDFSKYDLVIIMDSSDWERVSGIDESKPDNVKIINIDNHKTNTEFGDINLLRPGVASTCEMLWNIYRDWGVEINSNVALSLLSGIYGDTGSFQYAETNAMTLRIAADLIDKGADHNKIVFNLYRSVDQNLIGFMQKALQNMKLEKEFVWIAMSSEEYESVGKPDDVDIVDFLLSGIKGKDFGVRMIEKEPGVMSISFRSRVDFDVSVIAAKLGGGGHKTAAGAKLEGDYEEMAQKVLSVIRDEINK